MPNVIIVGAQWGDEGKGKVVDLYSAKASLIVRFQGGNNAGHTLVVGGKKTVLHLIPSGILHPGKTCLIASGVVFDPGVFFGEVKALEEAGALGAPAHQRIRVSERAHVILPFHRLLDQLREEHGARTGSQIGTTARGIGPAYEDKVARRGVQVIDLTRPDSLRAKLKVTLEEKNVLLEHHFKKPPISLDEILDQALAFGERLKPFIADARQMVVEAQSANQPILFEGAQGTLLDIEHGTYPYVTSSSTIAGGALTGVGFGPSRSAQVIGITKAYATRVGAGPFPTEMLGDSEALAESIRKTGQEFGATTGRPRRVGWLDLVLLRYAAELNGLTALALMKSDVLAGLPEIRVCTSYRLDGRTLSCPPAHLSDLERVEPVYETLPGWGVLGAATALSGLPQTFQAYVQRIEKALGIPVILISTGPGREETLELSKPFETTLNS